MNNNKNTFYANRIIKLISPLTCQTFKVELNGEENELRELLGTILEINPKSIKGLRDSYNNYYTLSSAVKNPFINTDPYNYYTVVIKGFNQPNKIKYMKYPSLNLSKKEKTNMSISESIFNQRNNLISKSLSKFGYQADENLNNINCLYSGKYNKNTEKLLKFADDLYQRNYIDYNVESKLKKLIKQNNNEVLSILYSYLNIKSNRNYDELANKIKPIIRSDTPESDNLEESKQNSLSSSISDQSDNGNNKKNKKSKANNKNIKNNKNKTNQNDKTKFSKEEKIFEDIKLNFSKEKYAKLKKMLDKKNKEIIKAIKNFEKDNDYNRLLSKLSGLTEKSENSENDDNNEDSEMSDGSSFTLKGENNEKNSRSNKKNKDNSNSKDISKISKNICNELKKEGKDLYYIAKFDLQKLKNEEKKSLFIKQFKLNLNKISNNDYKIPKKKIEIIKNYYTQYIIKKVCKNFNDDEKMIYEHLLEEDEDNNILFKHFKDLLNHKNLNELRNRIKKTIKETAEKIEEEGNEEDDDEKGKNSIKEESDENEGEETEEEEEEEEEEGDEEEEEEEEEQESENKSKSSSNKDTFILKDANKDRTLNLLNSNYKKINNINNNTNNDSNVNNNNNEENKNNNENNQNLGLGFVVVKQKKPSIKMEEKKDSNSNVQNNDENNKLNFTNTNSQAKESSLSTNNPNKKLNQFISQIEHFKKIDNIKKTIIEAVQANNKYAMDLYQKFLKNKLSLNPKSLNATYKQIIENPDTTNKYYIFKSLVQEIQSLDENTKEFLCDEFLNKNSELETYYSLYETNKEKDEFVESIEMFVKKAGTKKLLIKFSLKKIKKEIPNLLQKNEGNNNEDIITKSKEIMKVLQKYNLFNEKEYNIIMNSLENDDDVFTATFQFLSDNQDLNEFYETMTMALENQIKKEGNKEKITDEDWNNDIITKNFNELRKNIEERHKDTLEGLFKSKNEALYNILSTLNSSNLDKKIENLKTLILKRELSAN